MKEDGGIYKAKRIEGEKKLPLVRSITHDLKEDSVYPCTMIVTGVDGLISRGAMPSTVALNSSLFWLSL